MVKKMKRVLAGLLTIMAVVGGAGLGPQPSFAATCQRTIGIDQEVSAGEGTGTLTFLVHSGGCPAAGTVSYTVTAGSAQPGVDFQLANGSLRWAAGDTGPLPVTATLKADPFREADVEDFTVHVGASSPNVRVAVGTGHGRIIDDDGLDLVFVIDDTVCPPSGLYLFDVHGGSINCDGSLDLSIAPGEPVGVHWSTMDGTARAGVDFVAVDTTVTVAAGQVRVRLPLRLLPQPRGTPSRWFSLVIASSTAGTVTDRVAVITVPGS
jgi:FtsP/CotA-like multicopper oxidase with cupredoxin domain